jgi:chromosomal replication initiation ATPase DnaA
MNAKITLSRINTTRENWMSLINYLIEFQTRRPNGMSISVYSKLIIQNVLIKINYENTANHISFLQQFIQTFKQLYKPSVLMRIKRFRKSPVYTPEYFKEFISQRRNISIELMDSNTRKREVVLERQLAMYFSKKKTRNSLTEIGSIIGNKDHATVLHACKTISNLMDTNKKFRKEVENLEALI